MSASVRELPPDLAHRAAIRAFGESHHDALQRSRRRNAYFHRYLARMIRNQVLPGSRVLDIGCATGDLLAALEPACGVGIDINAAAIAQARRDHPGLSFHELAMEDLPHLEIAGGGFDYVILSGVLPQLYDLHTALEALRCVCEKHTRIIVASFSRLWQPAIRLAEALHWKARVPDESWLPPLEVRSLLGQCGFDIIAQKQAILMPLGIPLVSNLVNRWMAPLGGWRHLALSTLTVARMMRRDGRAAMPEMVSVIVPARNEAGNIKPLLDRIPPMGEKTQVIFVEGHSSDRTWEAIQETAAAYQAAGGPLEVSCFQQSGRGKGDAVRLGFAKAMLAGSGSAAIGTSPGGNSASPAPGRDHILIILDADLSVPPEELPRFVELITRQQCDFANGSRLVYPMENRAMQLLNMIANKFFGWLFTFLLGQRIRDTLCGTKALRASDYQKIVANRAYFGDFDPFGDFDLLFGAARLSLKITDVPVHYKQRTYGATNISRFRHGWLLLRMSAFAARKIKFV